MTLSLTDVLFILSGMCFFLAALPLKVERVRFEWLGMAFLVFALWS